MCDYKGGDSGWDTCALTQGLKLSAYLLGNWWTNHRWLNKISKTQLIPHMEAYFDIAMVQTTTIPFILLASSY